jgi:hypothetical protein
MDSTFAIALFGLEGMTGCVPGIHRSAPGRLGNSVGYLSLEEMRRVDAALRIVLDP